MDSTVTSALIALVILLLALSAFFSASETAYTSMNRAKIQNLVNDGNRKAKRAMDNYRDFDRFLTTILVGNNIVNIASSTICTAVLSDYFGAELGVIYATVLMITVLLICGEITPKTLAKWHSEKVAMATAGAVHWCMMVLAPLTWGFLKLTGVITKKSADEHKEPSMTEEELSVMIDEIQQEGTLEKQEGELIKSAIQFDDIRVSEICVPRVDIVAVNINTDIETMKNTFVTSEFSRIPIYEGTVDHVVGAIFIKDFFMRYVSSKQFRLTDIIRPVKFVPENTSIATVMNELQKAKLHLAIVLDDFGGTVGMVTLEDILEELVGEIWDESDTVRYPVVKESDGTYTVLGDANIFDVMEKIGQSFDSGGYESVSVGGYIYFRAERIPQVGDEVDAGNVRMFVKSIRNRRIREVTFVIDPSLTELKSGEGEES